MYSVTPEAPTNVSFQGPPQRSVRSDQSSGNDRFGALVDSSAAADTGNDRATSTAQQQSASQRRSDDAAATAIERARVIILNNNRREFIDNTPGDGSAVATQITVGTVLSMLTIPLWMSLSA